ncbi:uncharacterized protein ZBAI_01194 [Zygosaccharomyces bailii ISA1307]|nr:uncharacterized protein ZBAI_01194 [Zygosaccharomyces bailii ISA1307]
MILLTHRFILHTEVYLISIPVLEGTVHVTPQVMPIAHSTIVCESLKLKNNVLMRENMTEKGKQIKHGSSRKRWLGAYSRLLLEHWTLLSAASYLPNDSPALTDPSSHIEQRLLCAMIFLELVGSGLGSAFRSWH